MQKCIKTDVSSCCQFLCEWDDSQHDFAHHLNYNYEAKFVCLFEAQRYCLLESFARMSMSWSDCALLYEIIGGFGKIDLSCSWFWFRYQFPIVMDLEPLY